MKDSSKDTLVFFTIVAIGGLLITAASEYIYDVLAGKKKGITPQKKK